MDLIGRLRMQVPIVQAPMAGATTPAMAAAVCEAGGLGSLAAAYLAPAAIETQLRETRQLTRRPFAVNLFAPFIDPEVAPEALARALAELLPFRERLGLPAAGAPARVERFEEQFIAVMREPPAALSFCFGLLPPEAMAQCRAAGTVTIGTATSVDEARALADAGVDAICAQGPEAGAHRGTFDARAEPPDLGLSALLPGIVAAVRIPVLAAGGIMDGRGIREVLALGAVAAQLGTFFLRSPESSIPQAHKDELASGRDSVVTRAFSGRPARALGNRFTREVREPVPFPVQNALTRAIRQAAAARGDVEALSLWAGAGAVQTRALPSGELVRQLARELQEAR
jgi:nitronate monooxygenase